jgi:hypothetical protein
VATFLFASSALAPAQPKPEPVTTHYHGTIGHTLEIQITLTVTGTEIAGSYEYATQRKPIALRGQVAPLHNNQWEIEELDANGQAAAKFTINDLLGTPTGTWQSGKKKLPVTLGVITPAQLDQLHKMWSGSRKIRKLVPGAEYACVLTDSGAFCWGMVSGSPSLAAAGPGTVAGKALPHLGIPADITALAIGDTVSCYAERGGMYCWQPHSPYLALMKPTLIPGFEKGVTDVGISGWSACALVAGALQCWPGRALDPKANIEPIGAGVTRFSTGMPNCAVADGKLICWIANSDPAKKEPSQVREVSGVSGKLQALSAYDGWGMNIRFGCALEDGALKCWGDDIGNVLLGRRGKNAFRDVPPSVMPSMESGVTDVSVRDMNVCAIRQGTVLCWGSNLYGQSGSGTTSFTSGIGEVKLPAPAMQVALGENYACAVTADDHVWCWGDNEFGQTGNASHDTCQLPNGKMPDAIPNPCNSSPVQVRGLP